MLQISNLKKHFGGVKAVDGCSFEIKPNTITALIGPNGSGKSTLFDLISGIIKPDSGNIKFNKENLTNLSVEQISNKGISRLFQQSRLFSNLTIEENLELALNQEDTKFWKNFLNRNNPDNKSTINSILKLVNMSQHKNKKSSDLSFGQKRLIEIARSILNPHKLLMLDEPVAGVNPKLRNTISRVIKQLKQQGDTILLIEHDMNFTLNIADHVIVLDNGKVIAEGTPDQIRNNKKVLEAYLGD
ncbi:ABC transporter ATP-binding protein [Candidatus Woesearchaeota archaeon]|jgi:ABC-type branched-subunit amino acid transport system ATPase component|nr:ABC transporter ATP-binding protein [Candidatus Woesearchaeota archaeon]MBT4367990.1 ABC transporter ATP-binding protein [Candidatus Woesearchaeota archaeon]MBT4712478.1 ABC transporter ATP-binding protein [Candidatus Woesearchaeota archaeon]MBT6639391.1 ABC transporter ATP-binding protein [Candidatus Woesearchaeota archaeon]MBT7133563.1 ABC transporter ATP-binding protein [Candidatus Woesearchaeota archaeon]